MIEWKEAADKAAGQLRSVVSDLTGGLGDDLRDALVNAFKDGTDASKAFGESVNKTLENIMSNMIFNKVFEGAFAQLEADMNASYGIGADGKPVSGAQVDQNWTDDIAKFYKQMPELTKQLNEGLSAAQKEAEAAGMEVFKKTTNSQSTGLSNQISRTISEVTGTELAGLFRTMTEDTRRSRNYTEMAVKNLVAIEANTFRTANNTDRLEKIEGSLSRIDISTSKTASRI